MIIVGAIIIGSPFCEVRSCIMGAMKLGKYFPKDIEGKWQEKWKSEKLYSYSFDPTKESYYNLVELPYPSGDLHLGHWFAFVPPDVHARYNRMQGKNVFFPNGFDAFGLPAENAAIKRNIHPQDWTLSNIETMHKQFGTMGTMIAWDHEVITCEPEYYAWNQWIFVQLYKKGLAYRGKSLSNWCPSCQTVLANEAIENGTCWRCGTVVVQKEIAQWYLKITEFADELLWQNTDQKESNNVNWPRSVREGQNNWIGRSEGCEVEFAIVDSDKVVSVFTTRPDTLYGATFLVLAPEHMVVKAVLDKNIPSEDTFHEKLREYVIRSGQKTEMERKEQKEKTGVFSGVYAVHPLTKERIPVWVADYVLAGYGTGAIMAVPAHDERDFEFAKEFKLEIRQVIQGNDLETLPYVGPGVLMNSEEWNGWQVPNDIAKVIDGLEKARIGRKKVSYHLHDWSISRQRYWGTPVPMIHCGACGIVPVPEKDLPVTLPYEVDYKPKGKPPLATAEEWVNVSCPNCGGEGKRDVETLDTFFDSSWYYYRYMNPTYKEGPFDPKQAQKIMPVDIYFGGAEHTLGHTLYARFFTKFFKSLDLVEFDEFAKKRVQHGVILGPDGNRMSKSKGNVVNPDDVVKEYGSDTVRVYLCFMMPYEDTVAPWNPKAIAGMYRFLSRVWQLHQKVSSEGDVKLSSDDLYFMDKTIQKVGEDIMQIKFNTALASLMEWLNSLSVKKTIADREYKTFLLLLAPFAPHMTEEIWQSLGGTSESIHLQQWPSYDIANLQRDTVTIAVSINGKVRDTLKVDSADVKEQDVVEAMARKSEKVIKHLEGKNIKNVIYVASKILNFVVV